MIVPRGTELTSMATGWSQHRQIEWHYIPASRSDSFVERYMTSSYLLYSSV
ncbi:hypothetical protein [Bradyrhizobium sp. RDI18]|uniref:hypothetical protein n=1 Tax=Bradyrhizobium sp. RDI18 TaxID=3367400 RepID=UPI003710BADF